MSPRQFVVQPDQRDKALNVMGAKITILVSENDSQTQRVTLQSGDEGKGPPSHSHEWDESFYVIKGQVHFVCDGQTTICLPGTLVYVPGGTTNGFSFGPDGGELLEFTGTGSKALELFRSLHRENSPAPDTKR